MARGISPVPFRYLRYYLPQTLAEVSFHLGMIKDVPIASIPPGGCADATNFLLEYPGRIIKRSGWGYQGSAAGANTNPGYMVSAPVFNGSARVIVNPQDGHLYDVTSTASDRGGSFPITIDTPKMYPYSTDKLIVTNSDGATGPTKVYLSGGNVTFGALGGSPPAGKYAAIYANRLVLGGSTANPNRVYFSPAPDVEGTWDTTNSFIDTSRPITGLASVQGALLVFSADGVERIIGDIPPGNDGDNMSIQQIGSMGCADARTIASWGTNIIFASRDGVYVTNGSGFDSITDEPNGLGIGTFYRLYYANAVLNSGQLAGGVLGQKHYFLSINTSGSPITLCCYLPTKTWYQVSNMACTMYATGPYSVSASIAANYDELYGSRFSTTTGHRVIKHTLTMDPAAILTQDADGTDVHATIQTRMIGDGIGLKAYEFGHITYDASASPGLAITVERGINAQGTNFTPPESPLTDSSLQRRRFTINMDAQGIVYNLTTSNAVAKCHIYAIETEVREVTYGNAEFVNA